MDVTLLITVFIFSALVGSFLNVVIYRLPIMLEREWQCECRDILKLEQSNEKPERFNLCLPPSHCPQCNKKISPFLNVPIISYLLLKGRSACCRLTIPRHYFIVECLCPILSTIGAYHFGLSVQTGAAILLTWMLITASFIDFKHQIIPDNLSLPMLWLGLLLNTQSVFVPLSTAVIGTVAGYLSLWSITYGYKALTGKMGMGHGDFKLLALFGAWLGWQVLPMIILAAALLGGFVGIILILSKKNDGSIPIAFGPYLAIAGWVALLWGQSIITWYLQCFA